MQCELCRNNTAEAFLDLGQQPLANKYPRETDFASEDFFPMKVFFCTTCRNVQLGTKVSRERMFEDYYYLSSVNLGLVRHFETLAEKLSSAKFVVDIGSNDGILLKPLKERGAQAVGIEPSINVSKIANDAGLETLVGFFTDDMAKKTAEAYGRPDVIVASSVFTHLDDPHTFIEAVKMLLDPQGKFIIEVEYIGNIIKKTQFERFYLDRIFYYSLTSLKHLFESHGMHITDVEHIEPHGGSLQVTIQFAEVGTPTSRVTTQLAEESELLTLPRLTAFQKEVQEQIAALKYMLEDYKKQRVSVAGYGAPARVTTICNFGQIGPELVPFTVDDSPLKQNKYTPGTHIPIVPQAYLNEHPPQVLLVFAYEYIDDIRKKTEGKYRYMMPIPPKEIT